MVDSEIKADCLGVADVLTLALAELDAGTAFAAVVLEAIEIIWSLEAPAAAEVLLVLPEAALPPVWRCTLIESNGWPSIVPQIPAE